MGINEGKGGDKKVGERGLGGGGGVWGGSDIVSALGGE